MADQTFAVHCGFFDAIDSDRTYSADEMNRPYRRVISNGVFATPSGTPSTDLQVVESSGMNIICKAGEGLFADKWFENPSPIVITVPDNTATVPRIDSVLVQVDTRTSGRVGNIVYRTGTPASSPTPPAINQTEGVVEYRLANIRVNAGVTSILGRYITDRRGSSDCPWVTSLIYQVDTSTLYDQWASAYAEYFEQEKAIWDAWYSQLTEDLDVSMTLDRHTNTVTTTAQTTGYIPIGLAYNHNTDILEVYINGLRAVEGTHYVVVDDTTILVENQLQIGQEVTFVVMRSVISGSATTIMVLLQELENQIAGIAGGTPTVVDAKADMTEHGKIYILSSDSKWYYYSTTASDWVAGGTYGGVPTDTTLSISGSAADAKAVGDAVDALDDRVTALESDTSGGLTDEIKQALLDCFANVAWANENGQTYYDALDAALNPPANLSSITCVYTQSGTVYDTSSLDDLKPDLVVTAHWSDNTTSTITTYTLSGTLTAGTSTITVSYGGKTTTFTVTVTLNGWLYRFDQTLASSGSEDFDFTGVENYSTGVNGVGYSYHHVVGTEGTASTDVGAIVSYGITDVPDFSGDFTVSLWCKTITQSRGSLLSAYNCLTTAQNYYAGTNFGSPQNVKSGWSVAKAQLTKRQKGIRLRYATGGILGLLISNAGATDGTIYNLTAPSGFDTTLWHHLAVVRNGSTLMVFVDGDKIFDAQVTESLCFADQVSVGGYWEYTDGTSLENNTFGNYFDDLYVAEHCKWTASFDPSAIVY